VVNKSINIDDYFYAESKSTKIINILNKIPTIYFFISFNLC